MVGSLQRGAAADEDDTDVFLTRLGIVEGFDFGAEDLVEEDGGAAIGNNEEDLSSEQIMEHDDALLKHQSMLMSQLSLRSKHTESNLIQASDELMSQLGDIRALRRYVRETRTEKRPKFQRLERSHCNNMGPGGQKASNRMAQDRVGGRVRVGAG